MNSQTIYSTATATLTHTLYDSAGRTPASPHFLSSTATYYDDFGRVVETRDATGLRTGTVY